MHDDATGRTDDRGHDGETRSERWVRVERLFHAVFDQPPDAQTSLLQAAAASDPDIVDEVRALLAAHTDAGESFLGAMDVERAATFLAESDTSPQAGQRIGPYVVERELGRGGMAVIYLARDSRLEREVALKLLSPALASDPDAGRRLLAEARAAANLDHPNIATVHDIGETEEGRLWIAMARYRGMTLRERIARGRMTVTDALHIAAQIVAGLGVAHARGIIHRDIKPANVMITEDGTAKILDFGIARSKGDTVTRQGTTIGTVAYMSPEQTVGEAADERSDVWAVGVVLYEMLSGRRPFQGQNDSAVIHGIRVDPPPSLRKLDAALPSGVVHIVERCLMKEPARRYATMRELGAALAEAEQVLVQNGGSGKSGRRRMMRVAGLSGAALLVASAMVWRFPSIITSGPVAHASASNLVVLPFAPAVGDSSLARLGVELAITLARALDGVGNVRVHDPLAIVARHARDTSFLLDNGVSYAQERGASSVIRGSIVRTAEGVRIDATLNTVNGERIAQASVTGASDDITGLTDAIAVALLRQLWRRGKAPVPNLAGITTHSMPALRAYLEGERAIAESRFYDAPEAFERAIAADSTFWFAYWRLWYVKSWHSQPVDSGVRAAVANNLAALPAADSALASSRFLGDELARHEALRRTTREFPNYWPAWFDYGDWLVHHGPYLGFPLSDARAALEQVVSLNPDLVPAWEHLFWVAVRERDASLSERILAELERLRVDSLRARELRYDMMQYYDILTGLVRSAGEADSARMEPATAMLARLRARTPQENLSTGLHMYGFYRAQHYALDRIAAHGPAPDIQAIHNYGRALAWAGRGAWDSALVSAGRYAREAKPAELELLPAQLAITGALVGAVRPGIAQSYLDAAVTRSRRFRVASATLAEIAWLEGMCAFVHANRAAIRIARARLREMEPGSGAAVLERSLAAFELAATGRIRLAGDSLAALEREGARQARQFAFAQTHPFLNAANRLMAARWLIASGETDAAAELLLFPDATLPADRRRLADVNLAFAPLALLERAHIAEARGQTEEARRYYAQVLERWDAPVPALSRLLPDAR